MFTTWTYKRALCMTRVYIAAKTVFALMVSVWCVRVGHSSRAQCTKSVHPLVLSVFFCFAFLKEPFGLALVKTPILLFDLTLIDCTVQHTPPAVHYPSDKGEALSRHSGEI